MKFNQKDRDYVMSHWYFVIDMIEPLKRGLIYQIMWPIVPAKVQLACCEDIDRRRRYLYDCAMEGFNGVAAVF